MSSDAPPATPPTSGLNRFFKIAERGSTVGREVRGGLVTFFAMAYIIALNPLILGFIQDVDGQYLGGGTDEPNLAMIAAATALIAGLVTIAMGVFANFPLALAAGLGLNAFVAFGLATQMSWQDAMGLVVIEGIVILILVLTGFRVAVFKAIPVHLKTAISVGIGLFIALVGFVNAGFVKTTGNASPPIGLGDGSALRTWPVLVFCIGLVAVLVLYAMKVRGAILWTIVGTTILAIVVQQIVGLGAAPDDPKGWNLNVPEFDGVVDAPDFSLLGRFSLLGSWEAVGAVSVILFVFTLLLADFFDTMGTMVAVGAEGGLLDDEGNPPKTTQILIVDSVAAAAGGAGAVSSNTSYIESASGVGEGARTGLASVVTGICFLLATFLAPLVAVIPNEAAAPALVLVGFLMMAQVKNIPWDDLEFAIPAFLTITLMPFTYSITTGIGAGFLSYVIIKVARGKAKQIHPLLWVVTALFVVYFAIHPIEGWLGVS